MNQLLENLAFVDDPFASTNADEEPLLERYFVPPPYFATVRGTPANPKSHVVLAPRGGGKTAQRKMIEQVSDREGFLCVTYDVFDVPAGFVLSDATWDYHVRNVCRLITLALLVVLEADPERVDRLSDQEQRVVKFTAEQLLGTLSTDEFEAALNSVKTFGDKAKEFWTKYGGPVAGLLNVVLERLKLHAIQVDDEFQTEMQRPDSLRYLLRRLSEVSRSLGFESTYVLVDRVDEIELTQLDAASTFAFIRSLLVDLPTLEQEGLAFKFFLWDAIRDEFMANGARPDRVPIYELEWSEDDLKQMISERLKAFSEDRVSSLRSLFCGDVDLDVDLLVAHLATGSPRDMIRMMDRIVAEETRVSADKDCITREALWSGIKEFSEIRSNELFPLHLPELRRVGAAGRVSFTVNYLASDVYRVTAQAARARVQNWQNTRMVGKLDEQPNPPNRPMHVYGPVDLRLAIAMLANYSAEEVLSNYALLCPECASVVISDRNEVLCATCSHRFELGDAKSLIEHCT